MRMRSGKREELSVNLTPLIDVVFLLLIFFMVSASFNRESQIVVDLPEASNQEKEALVDPIEITIDADGLYYVNGQQLVNTQFNTLRVALAKATEGRLEKPLIISADGNSPHQSVVKAMDAARQLGIIHMSIATKQRE